MPKDTGTRSSGQLDMFLDADSSMTSSHPARLSGSALNSAQPLLRETVNRSSIPAQQSVPVSISSAEPPAKIEDAGEELVANRRNRVKRGIDWSDIENLNESLRLREAVKSNVWPKPDYAQMIADGMQPMIAHIYKQVYDSIAAKPAIYGEVGEGELKNYITGIHQVQNGLNAWSQHKPSLSAWAMENAKYAGSMIGKTVEVTEQSSAISLMDTVYPNGWRGQLSALRSIGGNKVLGALQPGYQEIRRAIKGIDAGWPNKREAWEVQGYKVVENPSVAVTPTPNGMKFLVSAAKTYVSLHSSRDAADQAAAKIKPVLLLGKRGFVDSFNDREEAVAHVKSLLQKSKSGASQEIDHGSNVVEAERTGSSRRMDGEDITSERLMEEFGLRGVNLGNWMKTPSARAEAQLHLNHAFDAFHDLAEILNIPPKAIGLGGMLGLAIGAQGRGGNAAGHFVPGVNEINLTRTTGAGVLSHEYAHALDHYFGTQAGLGGSDTPYLSYHAEKPSTQRVHAVRDGRSVMLETPRFGEVRSEILHSIKNIVQVMSKRELTPVEMEERSKLALERTQKNVRGWLKSFERDFQGLEKEFGVLAGRVLAGDFGGQKVLVGSSNYVFPVVAQMRELYKSKHGRLYSLDQTKGLQANLDYLAFQTDKENIEQERARSAELPSKVSTEYATSAAALDKDKGGKAYWATTHEMFARAFDSYVADRLESISAKNSYLTFGVRETPDVPVGDERKTINKAFNALIGELRVKDMDVGSPAIFSVSERAQKPLAREEIDKEIDRLRGQWKGMPEVHVVDTHQELPFDSPADADGAYHDEKVYVISGNIANVQQLQRVMAHECVMHHSLEQMLGNYGFAKLHHGVQSLKAKGDPTITGLAANIQSRYGDLPPETETKEIVARAGELCLDGQGNIKVEYGFMKGVFAGVAGWIRDHGISVPFTNTELQGILHKSGEWAKNGPEIEAAQNKTAAGKLKALTGLFVGRIVGIDNGVVTQKVGRGSETVLHSMSNLSTGVKLGQLAEILYRGEKAEVKVQAQSHDLGR